mmetsp:Transcript_21959/g.19513  ORF Transcript_21959/g.19513 Transcript_21959/m.19513 type:complete len:242 (+) Transcript_21959:166-891(+)
MNYQPTLFCGEQNIQPIPIFVVGYTYDNLIWQQPCMIEQPILTPKLVHENNFFNPLNKENYCLCSIEQTSTPCESLLTLNSRGLYSDPLQGTNGSSNSDDEKIMPLSNLTISLEPMNVQRKKKQRLLKERMRNKRPEILKSLSIICNEDAILISKKKKPAPRRSTNSARRSEYIGVFKNGPNWQALIAIDGVKTYIGTYKSEYEASRAFDYYSLLLHGLTAITNFDYSKRQIKMLFEENSS